MAKWEYVINSEKFNGSAKAILINGKSMYSDKFKDDYIKEGYKVVDNAGFDKLMDTYLNGLCGDWKEITKDEFDDMLNVLPPLMWTNGGFFLSEMYTQDVSNFYQEWQDKYYTSMQRISTDRSVILDSLKVHVDNIVTLEEFYNAMNEKKYVTLINNLGWEIEGTILKIDDGIATVKCADGEHKYYALENMSIQGGC